MAQTSDQMKRHIGDALDLFSAVDEKIDETDRQLRDNAGREIDSLCDTFWSKLNSQIAQIVKDPVTGRSALGKRVIKFNVPAGANMVKYYYWCEGDTRSFVSLIWERLGFAEVIQKHSDIAVSMIECNDDKGLFNEMIEFKGVYTAFVDLIMDACNVYKC